jgi:hypothetical protein
MEKFSNNVMKVLAVACAILFVLTVGIALLLFNAEQRLFNAGLYTAALESQNFYERLPALAAETLAGAPASADPNSPRSYLNMLPNQNWETLFRALLPAEVSRPMTEQAIASIFTYLDGKSETVTLSLAGFKTHLAGPAGTDALMGILRAQPNCTFEQITQLTIGSLFGQKPAFILCNPSDELLDLFQPLLQSQIQVIASTIPDSVNLTPSAVGAENPLKSLRMMRATMRVSSLLPLGFLLLLTIFAVRNWKGWLQWWGISILTGGMFGAILAATAPSISDWAFRKYAAPRIPESLPASVHEMMHGIFSAVLSGVAKPILIESAALGLIGILMLVATRLKKFNKA